MRISALHSFFKTPLYGASKCPKLQEPTNSLLRACFKIGQGRGRRGPGLSLPDHERGDEPSLPLAAITARPASAARARYFIRRAIRDTAVGSASRARKWLVPTQGNPRRNKAVVFVGQSLTSHDSLNRCRNWEIDPLIHLIIWRDVTEKPRYQAHLQRDRCIHSN